MYWLIETKSQVEEFINKGYSEVFIEIVMFNDNIHPAINELSLLYLKPLNNDKGYMLCLTHDDTLSLDNTLVDGVLNSLNTIFVRDKKQFLHFFPISNVVEVDGHVEETITTNAHSFFYQKYGTKNDINLLIPISKHYERCELIFNQIKDLCIKIKNTFVNKRALVFSIIESNGIKIDTNIFSEYFNVSNPTFSIKDNIIYTNYNFYTTTGRPSNRFNNINFAALKKDGSRKTFIPKNDYFIEYDLTAYHPILLSKIIGFDFGKENPYEYFSREANIPLTEAKVEFIKQMYGGVFEKYSHIEFFKQMQIYLNNIWNKFQIEGQYTCVESGTIFYKDKLQEMTPGKLLSYIIQNLETSNNVNMMWEMLKILRGKETQLILYTYDSFCFDVKKGEEEILEKIKTIFETNNFQIKTNIGLNYGFTK